MGCGVLETLIPLALSATGAGLGVSAAAQERGGENAAIQGNINAQQGFQKKGGQIFGNALQNATPQAANQQIGQGQQQFLSAANNAHQVPLGFSTPLSTNNQNASNARAGLDAKASSDFAGYSNYPLQQNINSTLNWPLLGVNNAQASQRNSLTPALVQMAGQSQQGRASAGSLLSGIGSLLGGLGANGTFDGLFDTLFKSRSPGTGYGFGNLPGGQAGSAWDYKQGKIAG